VAVLAILIKQMKITLISKKCIRCILVIKYAEHLSLFSIRLIFFFIGNLVLLLIYKSRWLYPRIHLKKVFLVYYLLLFLLLLVLSFFLNNI